MKDGEKADSSRNWFQFWVGDSSMTHKSLNDQMIRYNNKTSGFDYMRIILALAILAWHSYGLSYGREAIDAALRSPNFSPLVKFILPMFFALSGFLVTSSLFRTNSIKTYLVFRGLRLFPALTVEVLLAAFVLGPIFTVLTLQGYFSNFEFYKYFLNIAGLVQYELPGLFENNAYPKVVNGSLWTVPYELECYIYLVLFSLIGVFRNKYFILIAFAAVTFLVLQLGFTSTKGVVVMIKDLLLDGTTLQPNLQTATGAIIESARILVLCFLAGSVLYTWREHIPYHPLVAFLALVISWVLLSSPSLYFYSPLPVAYLTVWLGLLNPPKFSLLTTGDYSYGIYLYAFPIQQVVSLLNWHGGSYVAHVLVSTAIVSIFAAFSWHMIEKPCLKMKKYFLRERRFSAQELDQSEPPPIPLAPSVRSGHKGFGSYGWLRRFRFLKPGVHMHHNHKRL